MDAFSPNDFSAHDSRFDSSLYPPTPSYNGSYNNSPFSATSDLPDIEYGGPKDDALGLFDPDPLAISSRDEYDPSSYDGPHAQSSLLMFDSPGLFSSPNVQSHIPVSLTPALDDMHSPGYYDHSSPGSSNGGETDDRRSPASSASSHPHQIQNPSPHLNFNSLRMESPYIGNTLSIPPDQGSPMVKPQSPPQLLIPDSQPQPAAPAINAPEGDGVGPRLHIVPATPVSGGGDGQAGPGGYGQSALLSQATQSRSGHFGPPANPGQAYGQPASTQNFVFPPGRDTSALSLSTDVHGAADDYLIPPSPSRGRSKSDTSLPAPAWATAGSLLQSHQGGHMGADPFGAARQGVNPLNLHDGSLTSMAGDLEGIRPSSASALVTSFNPSALGAPSPFTSFQQPGMQNAYLSPNMGAIRRSNSDGRGHRTSRSEDMRLYSGTNTLSPFPPPQEFLSATARQYLSASSAVETVASIRGHHRRTSSGSRDRSIGGSPRMSPYPSPSASPAHRLEPLPNISGARPAVPSQQSNASLVAKLNVTTTATHEASVRRRTNDAKFACPIPGCGSTFTRHFNLKGHLRSHNDQRPFMCKWPGCMKGFARQHDCKRHEQLHSNHRPFTCEGCKKPFARLDALNRHLRSEGGAGCAKVQDLQEGIPDTSGPPASVEQDEWQYNGPVLM